MSDSPFKPSFFERADETPDPQFYTEARLVAHIDEHAIEAASRLYGDLLAAGSSVLDLMSSYYSHVPPALALARLEGLGLNETELRENPQLSGYTIHDVNAEPALPYDDAEFDACVMTVSVQYLTRPVEVFGEVCRVLRPRAPFIVTYSNRMFPTKAVRIWQALDDRERAGLVSAYFRHAGGFGPITAQDRSIEGEGYRDPLFAVWAHKA